METDYKAVRLHLAGALTSLSFESAPRRAPNRQVAKLDHLTERS